MKKYFVMLALMLSMMAQAQFVSSYDIQYSESGTSVYEGDIVSTEGVVTASAEADNLWAVFIQQEGLTEWAGIQLAGGSGIYNLRVGDKVMVTGQVQENFGFTTLNNITAVSLLDSNIVIPPLPIDPGILTDYDLVQNEKNESMLLLKNNAPDNVYVVNENPDASSANYGDYRIGTDVANPDLGCRVLAGVSSSSNFSSLNVSYVNDAYWEDNSDNMNVPVIVVSVGDSFAAVAGILVYGFGDIRILPRNNNDFLAVGTPIGIASATRNEIAIELSPNPVTEMIRIGFEIPNAGMMELQIMDLQGNRLKVQTMTAVSGRNQFQVSLNDLIPGTYMLTLEGENTISSTLFVKQ